MPRFLYTAANALGAENFTPVSLPLIKTGSGQTAGLSTVTGNFNGDTTTFRFSSNLRGSNKLELTGSSGQTRTLTLGLWTEDNAGRSLNGRLFQDAASGKDYVLYYDDNDLTSQSGWQIAPVEIGKLNPQTGRRQVIPCQSNEKTTFAENENGFLDGVQELRNKDTTAGKLIDQLLLGSILNLKKVDPPVMEFTPEQRAFLAELEQRITRLQTAKWDFASSLAKADLGKFISMNGNMLGEIAANKNALLETLQILGKNPEVDFSCLDSLWAKMSPQDRNSPEFVNAALAVRPDLAHSIFLQKVGAENSSWSGLFYLTEPDLLDVALQNPPLWTRLARKPDTLFGLLELCPPETLKTAAAERRLPVDIIVNSLLSFPHLTQNLGPEHKAALLEMIKNSGQPAPLTGQSYLVLRSFFPAEPAESFAGVSVETKETKADLDALFRRCQSAGINCSERFDLATLEKLLLFRERPLDPHKPVALVLNPLRSGDYNGAFQNTQHITDLLAHGYQVCYYEIGDETEIPQAFANTYSCNNLTPNADETRKIDVVIFGGHGTRDSIQLGNVPSATQTAEISLSSIAKYNKKSRQPELSPPADILRSAQQVLLNNSLLAGKDYFLNADQSVGFRLDYAELAKHDPEALAKLFTELEPLSPAFVKLRGSFETWLAYDRSLLDTSDKELAACGRYFSPTGILLGNSCSIGYKQDINSDGLINAQDDLPGNGNMIDAFYDWFSGAERKFYGAPDIQYGPPQISFNADNSISDVSYEYSDLQLKSLQRGAYYRGPAGIVHGETPISPAAI
jgi:hypothetical protein